jgi:ABC-type nitrate/sulfonate/bicarbonate transport system substrate-binding protein
MTPRRVLLQTAAALATPFITRHGFAQTSAPITVRGVYSAPGITYAGLFLATRKGLWAKNGIDIQLRQLQGGPLCMAALTNNEADFAGLSSTDPVIGWDKGIRTLTISAFTGALATQFTARNDWLTHSGVTAASTPDDKIRALKGARVGVATIGGGPAQYVRYLARSVGYDPETDMKLLAVGFGPARIAALRANQVDLTVGDAPEVDQVEQEGFGTLYLNGATDFAVFREFPYTIASITPEYAAANPEAARRIAQTIGQANDLFTSAFPEVLTLMAQQYPNVDAKIVEKSLLRDRATFPAGGRMTDAMWQNNVKVALATKMIANPISPEEGLLWTNKFNT